MNKMEAVIKLYKDVFPNAKLEQRGTWIRIDGSCSYHSNDLLEEIFYVTGKSYEWDTEKKELVIEYDKNDSWSTGNSWNTDNNSWIDLPPESEEDNLFEDIGEL